MFNVLPCSIIFSNTSYYLPIWKFFQLSKTINCRIIMLVKSQLSYLSFPRDYVQIITFFFDFPPSRKTKSLLIFANIATIFSNNIKKFGMENDTFRLRTFIFGKNRPKIIPKNLFLFFFFCHLYIVPETRTEIRMRECRYSIRQKARWVD